MEIAFLTGEKGMCLGHFVRLLDRAEGVVAMIINLTELR